MPVSTEGSLLPDDDWAQLQNFADAFATARVQGPITAWDSYLPPVDSRLRRPVVVELAKVDLELGWREGRKPTVEQYLERFPELSPTPVGLLVEEFYLRRRNGDTPELAEYQRRFPDQYEELKRLIGDAPAELSIAKTKRGEAEPLASVSAQAAPRPPEGYTLLERIGRGNFGEVWKAEAPGGIDVAIKFVSQPLDHDAAQRELQSLELIKKLQHPALLATLAFWIIDNRLVIAMELADGSLRDRLKECQLQGKPGIPADELLTYFRDAAVGLDYLHWQKVLHRDIKPENILLKKGYARVADFGLAKGQRGALMSVSFAGTPAFMAPEVWAGKACEQSDQYSLAFTYAELRLGRRPLQGGDFYTVMKSTLENEPELTDLPEAEQNVIRRALSKKPEDRFKTCQDFVDALTRVITPEASVSRRRSLPMPPTDGNLATERTTRDHEAPKQTSESTTVRTDTSAREANRPAVWKPPGPSTPKKSPLPIIVAAGIAIVAIGVAGYFALKFLGNGGDSPTTPQLASTSKSAPTTTTPTTQSKPPEIEKPDFLPPRFAAADPMARLVSIGGKKYHGRLIFRDAGQDAEFVLINSDGGGRPYYILTNKVWNGLMAAFASARPGEVAKNNWANEPPWHPAVHMTVEEAHRCAAWMGGKLPTTQQWDRAAAPASRATPADAAIARSAPRSIKDQHDDRTPAGVQDMLGNGREFTRNLLSGGTVPKPGAAPESDHVILRGRMWTLPRALSADDLAFEQSTPQRQFYGKPSPYTGFRVILEVE